MLNTSKNHLKFLPALAFALSSWCCTDGVSQLDNGEVDSGTTQQVDSGTAADAGQAVNLDGGIAKNCQPSWDLMARSSTGGRLKLESIAVIDNVVGVIYSEMREPGTEASSLNFYTLDGNKIARQRAVDPGTSIVAVEDRFLVGGQDGTEWYSKGAAYQGKAYSAPFYPLVAIGARVFGQVPMNVIDFQPAVLSADYQQVEVFPLAESAPARFYFGPERVLVTYDKTNSVQLDLFSANQDSWDKNSYTIDQLEEEQGLVSAQGIAAASWNYSSQAFDLIIKGRNGRFVDALAYQINEQGISKRSNLPGRVSYSSPEPLNADIAVAKEEETTFGFVHTLGTSDIPRLSLVLQKGDTSSAVPLQVKSSHGGRLPFRLASTKYGLYVIANSESESAGPHGPDELVISCVAQ